MQREESNKNTYLKKKKEKEKIKVSDWKLLCKAKPVQ